MSVVDNEFDPMQLVNHVFWYLTRWGCRPELRDSQLLAAEDAAAQLLRLLDVKPHRIDPVHIGRSGDLGPGW